MLHRPAPETEHEDLFEFADMTTLKPEVSLVEKTAAKAKTKRVHHLYNRFPFSECDSPFLRETSASISLGLRSSLRDTYKPLSSALQQYLIRTQAETVSSGSGSSEGSFHMGSSTEEEEDLTEESALDELFEQVAKKVIINNPLKSNLKTATGVLDSKRIEQAREQVCTVIDSEYTGISQDVSFSDIKNYVVNSVMQKSKNIKKLIDGSTQQPLIDEIDELVNDKYIDLKQDAFFDNCTVFFVYPNKIRLQSELSTQPNIYSAYRDIWQLQNQEYKYYDREFYYTEYFDILKFFSTKNQEQRTVDEYLKRALTMNVEKFMVYYAKELKVKLPTSDPHETDDESASDVSSLDDFEDESFVFSSDYKDDDFSFEPESNSIWSDVESSEGEDDDDHEEEHEEVEQKEAGVVNTNSKSLNLGKSIRFNDHVDIIGIHTEEPAFYVYCDRNSIEI